MKRRNLASTDSESWRPPPILGKPGKLRRFQDLQLASIWNDLRTIVANEAGSVLDVGCGSQPYRCLFPHARRYQGLDIAESNERFGYAAADTVFVTGYPWPIPDKSVDLVLCTEVLEHVLQPNLILVEMRRCLRPGGRLVMTVPFAARWHFVPYDYWRFTPSSLEHLLHDAGFVEVVIKARGNPLTVVAQKIIALIAPLRAMKLVLSPVAATAAGVGHWSLRRDWGEDYLGFTVIAV